MKIRLIFLAVLILVAGGLAAQSTYTPTKPGDRKGKALGRPDPNRDASARTSPVSISGTVILENGNPLPGTVEVQIRCQGSVKQDVYTSADGRFSFTLGRVSPSNTGMDASISGSTSMSSTPDLMTHEANDPLRQAGVGRKMPFGRVDLSGCTVEAILAGYDSDKVNLGIRSTFDQPDLGSIVLRARENVKGSTVSLNSLNAPKEATQFLEQARLERDKEEPDYPNAIQLLRKATQVYPAYAEAWQMLGELFLVSGDETSAAQAFQSAAEADPSFVSPLLTLSELHLRAGRWKNAADLSSQALALNPYIVPGHFCHAVARYYLGDLDLSLASIEVIQQSEQAGRFPQAAYLKGMILAEKGSFDEAIVELKNFLATGPPQPVIDEIRSNLTRWRDEGKISEAQASIPEPAPRPSLNPN